MAAAITQMTVQLLLLLIPAAPFARAAGATNDNQCANLTIDTDQYLYNSSNPDSPVNTVGSHVNITCKAGWGFVFENSNQSNWMRLDCLEDQSWSLTFFTDDQSRPWTTQATELLDEDLKLPMCKASRCANVTIDLGQYLYNSSDPNGLSTAFGSHVNVTCRIGAGAYFENSSQANWLRLDCEEGKGWSRTFFTGGDSQPQSVQPTELLGSIQ
uniref:Sushi domain-containing protein n=2 Tax=Macrostomum lignano TaxID=282301 RepID=A0A1I8IUM8_9PLAT